jgi:glycosyltransferase involved in cell wall biosynthesis
VAVEACRLANVPLKIVGDGPERPRLERAAQSDVTFLGKRTDDEIRELYRGASVVLLPGEEDFGIVPLEAQACGCPVVALGRGGALETVLPGTTGFLVEEPLAPAFAEAVARTLATPFDRSVIRRHAEAFSRERFGREMEALIESAHGPESPGRAAC